MKKLIQLLFLLAASFCIAQSSTENLFITKTNPKVELINTNPNLYSSSQIELYNNTTATQAYYRILASKQQSGNSNEGSLNFYLRKNIASGGYFDFLRFKDDGNHLYLNSNNTSSETTGNTIVSIGNFIVGDQESTQSKLLVETDNRDIIQLTRSDFGPGDIKYENSEGPQSRIKFAQSGGLTIDKWDGSEWVTSLNINDEGSAGLGVTPNSNWKLQVDGRVRAEEIKVEVFGAPDYVFEEDYSLRSLEETEAYIKANKHLPEVPSAKEMEANGVQLGEMNMLLLRKIEELTLHTIEQQKLIESLIKEVSGLKSN